jgi:hypothetical protein
VWTDVAFSLFFSLFTNSLSQGLRISGLLVLRPFIKLALLLGQCTSLMFNSQQVHRHVSCSRRCLMPNTRDPLISSRFIAQSFPLATRGLISTVKLPLNQSKTAIKGIKTAQLQSLARLESLNKPMWIASPWLTVAIFLRGFHFHWNSRQRTKQMKEEKATDFWLLLARFAFLFGGKNSHTFTKWSQDVWNLKRNHQTKVSVAARASFLPLFTLLSCFLRSTFLLDIDEQKNTLRQEWM